MELFYCKNTLKKVMLFFVIVACHSAFSGTESALDSTLYSLDQKPVRIGDISNGKPVYLKLWASWCSDCIAQMPHFEQAHKQSQDQITVLAVNVGLNDSVEAIKQVAETHALTMPMLLDKDGELAQKLKLLGTPMHVLIDSQGRVVHKGHEANSELGEKISVLSSGTLTPVVEKSLETSLDSVLALRSGATQAVLFTTTWCDWYLKDSRPNMAENCRLAPYFLNKITEKHKKVDSKLIVSRLWTEHPELEEFKLKYEISALAYVDTNNVSFFEHQITHFPTLVVFQSGREVTRITDFIDHETASVEIEKALQSEKSLRKGHHKKL